MPVAADDVVWLDVLPSMGRFRRELETEAGTSADSAGKKAGTSFTGAFGKALKIGAVVGGALAVAGGAAFLKEATREASNLGESLNAVNVTFGKNAEGINELGRAAATTVGLSQSQFNGLAVQFSAFATAIAGEGGDVTGVMKDLTTRGADFASVMNLDVNSAMETFQSGLAGETEPLRKYGIDLSAAAVESYAYANGIAKAGEELTEQQKVQARYGSLMEQTSKTAGDFTNTSDSLANSQRILGARWDDIQAKVGGKVIPVLEKFSGWVAGPGLAALQNLGGWIQSTFSPILDNIVGGVRSFGDAWQANDGKISGSGFQGFMERLGYVARQVFDFFRESVIPTMRDLAGAVLPALGSAFQTVAGIVSSTVSFFREHENAAKALGAVVAVVAGFVVAAWVTQATVSTINSVKSVLAWFATATASTTSATIQSRSTAQIVVGWLAASAAAVVNGVKIVAAWAVSVAQTGVLMAMYASQSIAAAARSTAAWVAAQVRTVASLVVTGATFVAQGAVMAGAMAMTAARVVGGWVLMGAQAMIQAARMAAAWFIALGPLGWVIAAVIGLVALIIANWDTVVKWTKAAWDAVAGAVVGAAQWLWDGVKRIFTALWDGVVAIFNGLVAAVMWVWTNFRDGVMIIANALWNGVKAIFEFLWRGVVTIFTTVRDTVSGIWNGFKDLLVNGAQAIWNFVRDKFNGMKDAVVGIFNTIKDTVGRVWDGLIEAVQKPIRIVLTFVNDKMIDPVNTLLDKFPGGLRIPRIRGFRKGGYTGDGNPDDVAGAVHKREFVFTAEQTDRLGVGKLRSLAASATGRDIGGPFDAVGDAWNATGGKVVSAVGDAAGWVKDMAVKGARVVAESVLKPLADAAKRMTPDNVIGNVVDGFIDRLMSGVLGKGDEQDKANAEAAKAADGGGGTGGGSFGQPMGDGTLGSNWASLFATIKSIIPQARLNSGVRNSRDAHGRGKAVDFGFGTGPGGAGSAGLASIKRVLHDRFGKNLYELIYNGVGNDRTNLKNSRPLAYSAGIQAQHRNHVHAAVYDDGGLLQPGMAGFNFSGGVERVLTPRQTATFERMVNANFGGPSRFEGNLLLDSGEFLGRVEGVATAVVDRAKEKQDIDDRRWTS